ncbi:AAA family ATPase [Bradyrhizobium tropiciagri]|uniref:AAA family ATPase n=1 Tax=Bradyrhizobium tropiciagri TaxID=312253 RepID=UPI000AC1FCE5|nr:AAA family ATPase [Bradyrhizobium tropiciagri]
MAQDVTSDSVLMPLPVELLCLSGWPPAALLFWARIGESEGLRDQVAADFWSGRKERSKQACEKLADGLFAVGRGEEALAALMLAADPGKQKTFEVVLPQLAYAIEHLWDSPIVNVCKPLALRRLGIWWRAARGDFKDEPRSIFYIAYLETRDQDASSHEPPASREQNKGEQQDEPTEPGLVVMPKDKASALDRQSSFKDLLDLRLPLVVARDLGRVRATLMTEYPHATTAIDLVLRNLGNGEPVRLKPLLLTGPAGVGKSRLVRRIGDLLGIGVYRYDGASASDNMFGGSPKGWSNTTPSAPVRAIHQMRIANPILMVDEIEKAGTSSHNGRLWDALLPFLESETAARYRDVSLDVELDLSFISYIATANSIDALPAPLRDRFRIIKIPAPRVSDLPLLAANVLQDLAIENGDQAFIWPLAYDELDLIARSWERSGFSIRKLQKIVAATIEARNATAVRH